MAIVNASIQHLADTASNFATANPTLLVGQIGVETDGLLTAPKFKIGNGTTAWNSLPYATSGGTLTLEQVLANGNSVGTYDILSDDGNGILRFGTNNIKLSRGNGTTETALLLGDATATFEATGATNYGAYSIDNSRDTIYHDAEISLEAPSVLKNGLEVATVHDLHSVYATARNNTGATILKGQVVYLTGAVGQTPTIALAQANAEASSFDLGVATFDIPNNTNVLNNVTILGLIESLNTSALTEGAPIYLSATTAGGLTSTIPSSPNFVQSVGFVAYSHAVNGKLIIRTEIPLAGNTTLSSSNRIAPTSLAVKTNVDLKANTASPTFTGTVTTPAIVVSSETASRVAIIDAGKNVKSADTTTYPSLTELAFVKGVTSAIQTQLNTKGVGTILGTVSASTGLIPVSSGVANTVTSFAGFKYIDTNNVATIGTATTFYETNLNVATSRAGANGITITNTSTATNASGGIFFGESLTKRGNLYCFSASNTATITGTSIPVGAKVLLSSVATSTIGDGPIVFNGEPIINIIGSTSTNAGTRLDAIGLDICTLANVHVANVNRFHVDGASGTVVTTIATTTTLSIVHSTVLVNAVSGAITVNLPACNTCTGRIYVIKKIDASVNSVTIDGSGAETIDGSATVVMSTQWNTRTIQSNGTSWFILSQI